MDKISVIGIDIAKRTCHFVGVNHRKTVVFKKQCSSEHLISEIRQLGTGFEVVMEACGASNYVARELGKLSYKVSLLPAQHVAKFRVNQKNDYNDAIAACVAHSMPNIYKVAIKDPARQDLQHLLRVRERLIGDKVRVANQLHGLLLENGIRTTKGHERLIKISSLALGSDNLSNPIKYLIKDAAKDIATRKEKIERVDKEIRKVVIKIDLIQRMCTVPGVGTVTAASIYAAVPDPTAFKTGRHFSAYLGLVPKQYTTGGVTRLGSIPKNGCYPLRRLIIHGARSVLRHSKRYDDKLNLWGVKLESSKPKNVATVALANKISRILWAIMVSGNDHYVENYTKDQAQHSQLV